MLLGEKERLRSLSEVALASERKRAVELAAQAVDLAALIAGWSAKPPARARAPGAGASGAGSGRAGLPAVPEANRLAPASPFAALKGKLPCRSAARSEKSSATATVTAE
jgi:septal ring factor EnvC (AmiA/AmiB activator)